MKMSEQDTSGQRFSVSVLGLGYMGSALARAFLAKQHAVTVWNRTASKAQPLAEAGAKVAASVAEAVTTSDVTVVCVLDYATSNALLQTPEIADRLTGKTLIQLPTGTPQEARTSAAWATQHGVTYLDGAIMATPLEIGTPECTLLYSGAQTVFDRYKPLLLSLGGNSLFVGENPGHAAALEGGLLSFLYATWIGFLHGAALCESEEISIESYLSATLQMLAGPLPLLMKSSAEMVRQRSYRSLVASLNANISAIEHIVQFSDENGVDRALPACLVASLKQTAAAGHGEDDLAAVFEIFRKKVNGGKMD
jgi:3-hydroxyisobutyrate dehydrogenase-like beta-hydroxyacid dehydrogenase